MPEMDKTPVTAGFWPRAAAFLLDSLILAAAFLPLSIITLLVNLATDGILNRPLLFMFNGKAILFWLITVTYFTGLTASTGSTLGKRAMRLRVIGENGATPGFFTVLYRETVGRYLSSLLGIGYLLAADSDRHRALHDRICDTLVVYDERVPLRNPPAHPPVRTPAIVPVDDPIKDWYTPDRI